MWKSITHALISTGHVAELHQELDHASRTGREDPSLAANGQLNRAAIRQKARIWPEVQPYRRLYISSLICDLRQAAVTGQHLLA